MTKLRKLGLSHLIQLQDQSSITTKRYLISLITEVQTLQQNHLTQKSKDSEANSEA